MTNFFEKSAYFSGALHRVAVYYYPFIQFIKNPIAHLDVIAFYHDNTLYARPSLESLIELKKFMIKYYIKG